MSRKRRPFTEQERTGQNLGTHADGAVGGRFRAVAPVRVSAPVASGGSTGALGGQTTPSVVVHRLSVRGSGQVIPTGSATALTWSQTGADPAEWHGWSSWSTPASAFSVEIDGVLQIDLRLAWDTYEGGGTVAIVRTSGAVETTYTFDPQTNVDQFVSTINNLTVLSGDTIEIEVTQTSGSNQTTGDCEVNLALFRATQSAPSFTDITDLTAVAYGTAFTVAAPTGLAEGDLLVCAVNIYRGTTPPTITPPAGWTQAWFEQYGSYIAGGYRWALFYKVAEASDVGSSNLGFSFTATGLQWMTFGVAGASALASDRSLPDDSSAPYTATQARTATGSPGSKMIVYFVEDGGPTGHSITSVVDANGSTTSLMRFESDAGPGGMGFWEIDKPQADPDVNVTVTTNPSSPDSPHEMGIAILEVS